MKLTLRPLEPGLLVGHVYDEWDDRDPRRGRQVARLYATPGCADLAADVVQRLRLRELRVELERRLDEDGPWWS